MGLIRVFAWVALVSACDKGKVAPAKGSAEPPPAPVPVAVDAMSIDEQILTNKYNPDEHVFVRICNDTGKDMADLSYGDPPFSEGKLIKADCTGYREAKHAYGYTFAAFTLGKDTFKIQPIDYMGEVPLDAGYWSYHVKVEDYAARAASIRARKDVDGSGASSGPAIQLHVRACNDTDKDFASLEMWGVVKEPGPLKKKTCSPYMDVDRALEAVAVSFTVGKDAYKLTPASDAKVKSLLPGSYSYRITIADADKHVPTFVITKDTTK